MLSGCPRNVSFAQAAAPYLSLKDEAHYQEALALIESLLEEAEDSLDDPLNAVIYLLSRAIETYENRDEELAAFEARAMGQPADLAMLRLLMAQHHLGTADPRSAPNPWYPACYPASAA